MPQSFENDSYIDTLSSFRESSSIWTVIMNMIKAVLNRLFLSTNQAEYSFDSHSFGPSTFYRESHRDTNTHNWDMFHDIPNRMQTTHGTRMYSDSDYSFSTKQRKTRKRQRRNRKRKC